MTSRERPVALITGASRGIGRAVALALAGGGFDIVGNATAYDPGNRESGLGEVAARVAELGARFVPAPGDIAALDLHEKLVDAACEPFGRIDLLVNNAGVAPEARRDILEITPQSYDRLMAVNARGAFFLTQRIARLMLDRHVAGNDAALPQPVIVFISSVSAVASSPSRPEYCISKAALSQTARLFADRLAPHGIAVFEVRPGLIRTDMTAPVASQYDTLIAEGFVPQGRWGQPEDVGRAVLALARGDFAYSTGMVLEVSGGMDIRRL
jgi:NAD(P)-dependent dehydrogenase (short-subunit alcohol dehydrogenase family)